MSMSFDKATTRTVLIASITGGVVLIAKVARGVLAERAAGKKPAPLLCGLPAAHRIGTSTNPVEVTYATKDDGEQVERHTYEDGTVYEFHVMTDAEREADAANSLRLEHDADLLDELTTMLGMQYVQLADHKDTASYRRGDLPGYDQVERQLGEVALAMSEFDLAHVRRIVEDMVANNRSEVEACGRFFAELLFDHDLDCDCAKIDFEQMAGTLDSVEETLDRIEAEAPKQSARQPFDPRPYIKPERLDGSHPCTADGCQATVEFDDEPWCFVHSPASGSTVAGYSYAATKAALAHLDEV